MSDDTHAAGAPAPAADAPGPWIDWAERTDPPLYAVTLWPHRSLRPGQRRTVMGIAAAGFALPLMGVAGTVAFWGLLPFCAAGLAVLWIGITVSMRQARVVETLAIWADEMRVERREPSGRVLRWRAFPAFVRPRLRSGGPVANYLTLTGGGREIELGRFLTAEERARLKGEIETALAGTR